MTITITENITVELLDSIGKEARSQTHIRFKSMDVLAFVDEYLRDMYNIYIKRHTNAWGETTYYNILAFYANCPDYKLVRRKEFLYNHGKHFNCMILSSKCLRHLKQEYQDHYYLAQVCKNYRAYHTMPSLAGCHSLTFKDQKHYNLLKLKYSEFL